MARRVVSLRKSPLRASASQPMWLAAGVALAPAVQAAVRDLSQAVDGRFPQQDLSGRPLDLSLGVADLAQMAPGLAPALPTGVAEGLAVDESLLEVLQSSLDEPESRAEESVGVEDLPQAAGASALEALGGPISLGDLGVPFQGESWVLAQAGSASAGGVASGSAAGSAGAASAAVTAATLSPLAAAGIFVGSSLVLGVVVGDDGPVDTEVTGFTARLAATSDSDVPGDNRTSDRTPTFEGTAEVGASVKLTLGGQTFTAIADAKGNWSITVPDGQPLAPGQYQPTFLVTDVAGNSKTFAGGDLSVELTKTLLVVDGPLHGAKVYYDKNKNGIADDGEYLGETNETGGISVSYVPVAGARFIIVPDEDTVDVFTGNKFDTPLQAADTGEDNTQVVSPLSTLVASAGVDEAELKASLGIPAEVNLATFNFLTALEDTSNPVLQQAAQKVAAATVVVGNVMEATIKAAQAGGGEVLTGAQLQNLTSEISETIGKVMAALPADTPLELATQIATKITMSSTLDSNIKSDDLIAELSATVQQAVSSGSTISQAVQAAVVEVNQTISETASSSLQTLITTTSSSLATVSKGVEDLFKQVASGAKSLEQVVGLGGEFDKLEDKAEEQVQDAVNVSAGVVLKKSGLFDDEGNGHSVGPDAVFLEDDEYFVEGTPYTVKGNVFEGATGVPATGVHTVGIGALQALVPDYVKGSASDPAAVGSTFTLSTSDFGKATVNATDMLASMGLPGTVPLTGSWVGGGYNFKATAGSGIVKTITVNAGDKLTFAYKYGSFDYLPWNDYGFIALKLSGGSSLDDGVREIVDVRDLKGPQLYKDAGVWKINNSGEYSYTFTQGGTYTLGIGATDVGDKIFDTILTVQNLRVNNVLLDGTATSLGNVEVNAVAPIIDVAAYVQTGKFGVLTITKTGDFFYQPGGANADDVPPGALLEDTFEYTVKLANGFLASQKVVFTVMGEPEGQLSAATDTAVAGDSITFDATPVLTGKAAFGSQVSVTVAGKTYDTITVGTSQTWSLQLDALSDGSYTPSIQITNKGAVSKADGVSFTVDTAPPVFVTAGTTVNGSQVVLTYDSPLAAANAPTNAFVVAANGQTVAVSEVSVTGNKVVLTLATPIAVGQAVTVRYTDPSASDESAAVQDIAGNDAATLAVTSVANNVQDSTPPAAPVIQSYVDDVGSGSPVTLTADSLTNDPTPTLSITAEAGSSVQVFRGSTPLGNAVEVSAGQFKFTPAQPLAEGAVTLTAVATDKAGNSSAKSGDFSFTLDLTGPGVPGLSLVEDTGSLGALAGDLISSKGALKASGVESGGVVEYSANNGLTWSTSFSAVEGVNNVLVRQTDVAGNTSTAVTPFTFTLDTTAPAVPVITGITDNSGSANDRLTNDRTPVLTVTAEPGSKIFLGTGGQPLPPENYTVVESSPGVYTITVNSNLADGGYGLVAFDKAGNQSTPPVPGVPSTASFQIDATAPTAAVITAIADNSGLSSDRLTNDKTPILTVTAEPGSTLVVGTNGQPLPSTDYTVVESTAQPGTYTVTITKPLSDGGYGVVVVDKAGNVGPIPADASSSAAFVIDATAPAQPQANIATIIQSGSDRFVTGRAQIESGASLSVSVAGASTSTVGPNGFWRVDPPSPTSYSGSTFLTTVTATDPAGNSVGLDVELSSPLSYGTSLINATLDMGSGTAMSSLPAGFEFDAGDDVLVIGTNFLGNGPQVAGALSIFDDADVTTRFSSGDISRFSKPDFTDLAFDKIVDRLEQAGVDRVQIFAADLKTLQAKPGDSLSFEAGTDVQVLGTSFLNGGSASTVSSFQSLLEEAETNVSLRDDDISGIIGRTDASLDDLVVRLESSGIDRLVMSGDQAKLLVGNELLDFDAGTDITVSGTAFLSAPGGVAAIQGLFGEADLRVQLTQADSDKLLALGSVAGGQAFDGLIKKLDAAGVDSVAIDAGQVADFAQADFTFDGIDTNVLVTGTAFLNGGSPAAIDAAGDLFGDSKVTVALSESDVRRITSDRRDFDDLMGDLQAAGVDRIRIDANQAMSLAKKGVTLETGMEVQLAGDSLNLDSQADRDKLEILFAGNTEPVGVTFSNAAIAGIDRPNGPDASDVDDFLGQMLDAGIDHFVMAPDQLLTFVDAGLDPTNAGLIPNGSMVRLSENRVSLADFQATGFDSLTEALQGMDSMLKAAKNAGLSATDWKLAIDDELANALAEAGFDTDPSLVNVKVNAAFDVVIDSNGSDRVAFLKASAKDLVSLGVDKVALAKDTDLALALRDSGDTAAGLGFTLSDLPVFDKSANQGGHLGLVIDQDDLTALVNSLGAGGTEAMAFQALKAKGFTDLVLQGDFSNLAAVEQPAQAAGLDTVSAAELGQDLGVTQTDLVKLLGLGSDPVDPFDPFHKP